MREGDVAAWSFVARARPTSSGQAVGPTEVSEDADDGSIEVASRAVGSIEVSQERADAWGDKARGRLLLARTGSAFSCPAFS